MIGANARSFTDQSPAVPNDVASGDAAAGIAIDFYARSTEAIVGSNREKFIAPPAATAITPDPIAILYGTRGDQLELARHFIEFLLSPEGQKLWILKVGEPGGPRQRALGRPPIRPSVYTDQTGWTDDANYFANVGGFNQRGEWMGMLTDMTTIWAASMIDSLDELRSAYHAVLDVSDQSRRAALLAELADLPITRPELNQFTSDRKAVEGDLSQDADLWKARQRMSWAAKFREHYHQVERKAQGQ
jgi:ABC-type glycerol-3-phosphate transport system substrate-binding protein